MAGRSLSDLRPGEGGGGGLSCLGPGSGGGQKVEQKVQLLSVIEE
jgi:hypothetical protein